MRKMPKLTLPDGVNAKIEIDSITVSGPKGTVKKHLPPVIVKVEGKELTIAGPDKTELNTATALIYSAVKGVTEGFNRKMQLVYAHFPITIEVKGKEIYLKNFLGEKIPRVASIIGDTQVKVEKDIVTLSGSDSYAVGQTAANIRTATHIKARDPRVFQDGIYEVYE